MPPFPLSGVDLYLRHTTRGPADLGVGVETEGRVGSQHGHGGSISSADEDRDRR